MKFEFINRNNELALLEKQYSSVRNSFVVIYGRRRTGKTTLIREFIRNKSAIFFLGDTQTEFSQINNFKNVAANFFNDSLIRNLDFKTWDDFFSYLNRNMQDNLIIVIDEFQYLAKSNHAFPSILNRFWESINTEKNIMMIVSGSLISMMYDTVLSYNSPLYGRRTAQINLKPIEFYYYKNFFINKNFHELVRFFSVTGGIPKYIEQLDKSKTILENIKEKILDPGEMLCYEPKFLLHEEINDSSTYFSILKTISEGESKISKIAQKLDVNSNNISPFLNKLVEMDVLEKEIPVTEENPEKSKKGMYYIKDNFINFWFRFVFPRMNYIESGNIDFIYNYISENFEQYVSNCYEKICRSMIFHLELPFKLMKSGRWWDNQSEIDIVAIGEDQILFGECKWSNKHVGISVLNDLISKSQKVEWKKQTRKEYFVLFSRSGFSDDLIDKAKNDKTIVLIGDNFKIF